MVKIAAINAWLTSRLKGMMWYNIEKIPITRNALCASATVAPVAHCQCLNRIVIYKPIAISENNIAYKALKMVGMDDDYFYQSPFDLSGGQKRRVAIAGVLAMKPEVLILDEPTAGLDPMGRDEILDRIAEIQKERKITVILVSHSMEDVAKYVDRLIVMDHGSVQFDGTPKEVFAHYKELESMGLAAPQVTYIMQSLRAQGANVGDATTVEEARNEILKAWKKI